MTEPEHDSTIGRHHGRGPVLTAQRTGGVGSARRRGVKGHPATAALLPRGWPDVASSARTGLRPFYCSSGDAAVTGG